MPYCSVCHLWEMFIFHSRSRWPDAYRPVEVRGPLSPALRANVERAFASLKSQILFGSTNFPWRIHKKRTDSVELGSFTNSTNYALSFGHPLKGDEMKGEVTGYTQATRLWPSFMAEPSWKINVNEFNGEHSVFFIFYSMRKQSKPSRRKVI